MKPEKPAYITLSEDQEASVARMATEPTRSALNSSMTGVGKTVMAVELAKRISAQTVLVIAPIKQPVVNAWKATFEGQGVTHPFRVIDSSHPEHFEMLRTKVPGIYYVGREYFMLSATSLNPATQKGKIRVWNSKGFTFTRTTLSTKDSNLTYRLTITPDNADDLTPHSPYFESHFGTGVTGKRVEEPFLVSFENNVSVYEFVATVRATMGHEDSGFTSGRAKRWSWAKVIPDLAVFDEVQAVSNRWSDGYAILKTLRAGYKLAMSATPQGNRFKGIWSVCRWLWPDTINPKTNELYVDNSQWRWAAEWAKQEYDVYAGLKITDEAVPGAFVNSLPCYVRIESEHPPVDLRVVKVELTPIQRKLYDKMEEDMLVWLDEHPLVADIPIVQRMRMRQITLGEPTLVDNGRTDDDGFPILDVDFKNDCESAKIDALETIITKYHPDEPLFILMDSQKFARVVVNRLGSQAAEWSGAVSQKERQRVFEQFGKGIKYLVATIPAVAEGLDMLQYKCHIEVWLSQSLNEMLNTQARGRVDRQGQTQEVIRYYVHARDTDDDGRLQKLMDIRHSNRLSLRKNGV